jgi:hypothetical protein
LIDLDEAIVMNAHIPDAVGVKKIDYTVIYLNMKNSIQI